MKIIIPFMQYREMVSALALRDFQRRYAGTIAGSLWAVAHPLAIVAVFYFVFSIGFKAKGPDDVPFILWFSVGLMAWSFFNDTLIAITNSIVGNAHLVKKTVFPVEILAVVQMVSSLLPHLVFLAVIVIVLALNNIDFHSYRFLVFYFMLCSGVLVLGLGWILSALEVFYRDISQALTIIMNLWFWLTPIVWDPALMPQEYHWIFTWNPLNYVVDGYRGMLIYSQPRWPDISDTTHFWCVALSLLLLGSTVFRRLKPEFADVL